MATALLFVSGRAMARSWRRYQRIPAPPLADRLPDTRPDRLVDALDEGIGAMAEGPVDDVIVECWVRLEEAAAGAGVERLPSETPSELAARVLADLHAPPAAIEALLERYRTARYSHHRLDERDRARGDGRAAGDPRGDRRDASMIDRRTVVTAVLVAASCALLSMFVVVAAGWSPDVRYILALAAVGAVLVVAVRRVVLAGRRPRVDPPPAAGAAGCLDRSPCRHRRDDAAARGGGRRDLPPAGAAHVVRHRHPSSRPPHGVELVEDPEHARELLGDEPFQFLTDVVRAPISTAELERVVSAIEAL